jgi:uncharacterized protein YoxC
VTDWQLVWLGTMASALVVMAIVQVALVVVAIRLSRQATNTVEEVRREIRPLLEKATKMTDDAMRATALALAQVERIDELMGRTVERIDDVFSIVHDTVVRPLRQGTALVAGLRAALAFFRSRQGKSRRGRDDEDALFIG